VATIKLYRKSNRQPCYRLSYRDPVSGAWRQKLLHVPKEEAEELRKKVEAEYYWYQANPHLIEDHAALFVFSLKDAMDKFLRERESEVRTGTWKRYKNVLDNVLGYLGDVPLTMLTKDSIVDYREHLIAERKPQGVNTELRHLRAFVRYCADEGLMDAVKVTMIRASRLKVKWLTKDELEKILSNLHHIEESEREMTQDLIMLLLFTGARVGEVLNAKWENIDLKRGRVFLLDDKGDQGKPLYLNQKAIDILVKYQTNKPGPFPIDYNWIKWRYFKICREAGIKSSIHDLRKTTGAWLTIKTGDIYRVSKYLRHSSVVVTENYYSDLLPQHYENMADQTANFF